MFDTPERALEMIRELAFPPVFEEVWEGGDSLDSLNLILGDRPRTFFTMLPWLKADAPRVANALSLLGIKWRRDRSL